MDYEYEELAARMLGMSEKDYEALVNDEYKNEYEEIDGMLYEKFDISLETFTSIAKHLLPMTSPVETMMGNKNHMFGVFDNYGFRAIVTTPTKQ